MSKASRQKYAAPGATVRDATPEELAKLTVADVVIRAPVDAPDPILTALRDLARVMASETLRQVPHCSRCDRPARFSSGFTGSLCCQAHRDEQAALGQASFTALPVPVVAERLYAFVMGEE